jgi:hypothetical protein
MGQKYSVKNNIIKYDEKSLKKTIEEVIESRFED